MKRLSMVLVMATAGAAAMGWFATERQAEAQSGSRSRTQSGSGARSEIKRPHYEILWDWLQKSNYRSWNGVKGTPPDYLPGESPHGALIKTYVDKVAARHLNTPPHRGVIVKENYSPDKKLMAITVMQRSTGYDPEHKDWYYAKYTPDGKIATTPPEMKSMPIAGRFGMCIECHGAAGEDDFLFFND